MGVLSRFDVPALVREYGLRRFVETGAGRGDSLAYAASVEPAFSLLLSCELEPSLAEAARRRFAADLRVHVYPERSSAFVDWTCRLLPRDEPALFWLDAHFPGADYGIRGYGDEADDAVRLPLEQELTAIAMLRAGCRDVVVVDDLRIYRDGPFGHGNLPADLRAHCPRERNIGFVHRSIGLTHDVREFYEHEGYLLAVPRKEAA